MLQVILFHGVFCCMKRRPYPDLSEYYWLSGGYIRIDRGNYSCVAQNSEGRSSSNLVEIKVKCKYFRIFFKERPMVNRYAFLNDEALRCFWIMYEYLFFPWNYAHLTSLLSLFSFPKRIYSVKFPRKRYCSNTMTDNCSPTDRPICSSRLAEVIAVGLGEDVSIPCRVSASPTNLQFQWFFNSSDNKVKAARSNDLKYFIIAGGLLLESLH